MIVYKDAESDASMSEGEGDKEESDFNSEEEIKEIKIGSKHQQFD